MTKKQLEYYVDNYFDIEFDYKGKRYSITYYEDDREDYISFCEFYKEPTDVKNFDELCNIKVKGISILDIIESLPDSSITIY